MRYAIFISSVQKELRSERAAVRDYLATDPLLCRHFTAFLFEDRPATDRRADDLYLAEVDRADVYVGLLGNDYGTEDGDGISPTEREFDRATDRGITRLVFVKGSDDQARQPKMRALVTKASSQLVRRRFTDAATLKAELYASLVDYLESRGVIQNRPFEERPCLGAAIGDLDADAVTAFVRQARTERQFPLPAESTVPGVLTHLGMLTEDQPSNASILLFGREPQRFVPCAEVRCMHFHSVQIERPAPLYRVLKGNLFEQVDRATDFVLSVIRQSIGTREDGSQAPALYEIPHDVVREAVVNAIVHRDYSSNAAVQVSVFADRIEVWSPGHLLPPLTPESLRKPHRSVLRNPRIAEALFLARYIEKYGTGTLMMIRESLEHALPEPCFGGNEAGEFGTTLWRDWLTSEVLERLGLNERQKLAVAYVKRSGRITNADYQGLSGAPRKTAARDLAGLVEHGLFELVGSRRGAHYVLKKRK
jgi:predicted HTH transcriptional regulator